eukprot:Platyproteum_vivax@DN789_c0_g1_i1.p1
MNHLMVFDWDDTLFPSNFYDAVCHRRLDNKALLKFDLKAHQLLKAAQKKATVKIVSNANFNWLRKTMAFMPLTRELLNNKGIEVISAREENPKMPSHIAKTRIFHRLLRGENFQKLTSVGDGVAEYLSAHIMKAYYDITVQVCTIAPRLNPQQLGQALNNFLKNCILPKAATNSNSRELPDCPNNPIFERLSSKIIKGCHSQCGNM